MHVVLQKKHHENWLCADPNAIPTFEWIVNHQAESTPRKIANAIRGDLELTKPGNYRRILLPSLYVMDFFTKFTIQNWKLGVWKSLDLRNLRVCFLSRLCSPTHDPWLTRGFFQGLGLAFKDKFEDLVIRWLLSTFHLDPPKTDILNLKMDAFQSRNLPFQGAFFRFQG